MRTLKVYTVRCHRGIGCRGYRDITGTPALSSGVLRVGSSRHARFRNPLENYPCDTGTKRDYGFGFDIPVFG